MTELVLTIIGRDRAGIIAGLADVVRFHEGNWKRSEVAEIEGTFAGVIVVEVADGQADELLTDLVILREQGVHVTAQQIDGPDEAPAGDDLEVRFTGEDRPGILREISRTLGERKINIRRIGTVTGLPATTGGERFEITVRLAVPVAIGIDAVVESLENVAADLSIELEIVDDDLGQ